MDLIIVESPTKAKTIQKFLGPGYKIKSSFGHIRDLPKRKFGVDIEKNFEPQYVVPIKAKKIISELKKEIKSAEKVILATDEDREGESISWHLSKVLNLKNPERIVFHEITQNAVRKALTNPGQINMHLVNAQQARRVLDRIVGYKLSPFLWKKIAKGLSAGRVQSAAVKLIVEREKEIKKFVPQEYWTIEAVLKKNNLEFSAFLTKINGKIIDKLEIKNKSDADKILKNLTEAKYVVQKIEKKEIKKNPFPPFITSTLQQISWQKFRLSAKATMFIAQKLYEEGYITYHRTDSLNLSQYSRDSAKKFIIKNFGKEYWQGSINYKSKTNAQEAHEAIRPTSVERIPANVKKELDGSKLKIYALIWQRFIACQMPPAIFDATSAEISAKEYGFKANGQILKFDGFLKVYPMKFTETLMPKIKEQENLELVKINNTQHFTEPPARYNEATLIKAMEKFGIGRPSTYAPTLIVIQARNYVAKNEQKRFFPTEMGILVNDMLTVNFPEIVDIDFTAKMEQELDQVASGQNEWQKVCRKFYEPFAEKLKIKYESVSKENKDIKTDKICPTCRKPMVEKLGRFGRFYACTGFPECKYTESITQNGHNLKLNLIIACSKCKDGQIATKKTKKGKIFYGCNKYPECDFAVWDKPTGKHCTNCGSILVQTKNQKIKCSNKKCNALF